MESNLDYLNYGYMVVSDKQDFFKTNLVEITKLKVLLNSCSTLFKIPQKDISVAVSKTDDKVYRVGIEDKKLGVIGLLYYIPKERRLDLYDSDPRVPLMSWKNKKCIWKNYSNLLGKLNIEKLFQSLISGL
jgi:hypothetical protein